MTSESRSRFDAALHATYENIKFIAQAWQRHDDAIGALSRAKEATEAELAKIHVEIAEWHKKLEALLTPPIQRDSKGEQGSTGRQTENGRREMPDKLRRLLEQSGHRWKVMPKRDENAPPSES
jgi:hypothetical protein